MDTFPSPLCNLLGSSKCQPQHACRHKLKERGREHVALPRAWSQMQSLEQVHRKLFSQGSTFCAFLHVFEGAELKQPNHTLLHPMIIKSKSSCINSFSDVKNTLLGPGQIQKGRKCSGSERLCSIPSVNVTLLWWATGIPNMRHIPKTCKGRQQQQLSTGKVGRIVGLYELKSLHTWGLCLGGYTKFYCSLFLWGGTGSREGECLPTCAFMLVCFLSNLLMQLGISYSLSVNFPS